MRTRVRHRVIRRLSRSFRRIEPAMSFANVSIVNHGAENGVVVVQSRFHMVELRWDEPARYMAGRFHAARSGQRPISKSASRGSTC